ncbi:MAG TPA: F0F1 ATP synthase subunit delta [Candidatus Saccharimonadales bacterium]|nr:F0F1 ATP synthase subunit delta [Candidatus Saccharimonadales bacterium]
MAKVSYRRLAVAMVELLDDHDVAEVATAAVQLLAASGTKPELERLLPEVERELSHQRHYVVIHAVTARELPAEVMQKLAAELTKRLGGTSYELDTKVQPDLLGGAQLVTADASLDLSLRSRLESLRT